MATVYFTDLTTKPGMGLMGKLKLLLERLELGKLAGNGDLVAIKIHFGEYGNLAFIRPNYVRVVVDEIAKGGGKPFLTDANTLYKGSRANAIDHLRTATLNGFAPDVVGAPVVIADGLRGTDEIRIDPDGEYVKEAKIGSAIALANAIVVLTHFKGHEQTGFGGALKNIGMGSASRAGKLEQHSTSSPLVKAENCVACRMCERYCPTGAITVNVHAAIDYDKCIGCGQCVAMCNYGAIVTRWDASADLLSRRIVEYAKAALLGKRAIFISFITQVSPDCDCWPMNQPPVAPDIGIAASTDPVALDQACMDLVIQAVGEDPFRKAHPSVCWEEQLDHAEKIGLGTREYELERVATGLDTNA